jgi:hypothetical protein
LRGFNFSRKTKQNKKYFGWAMSDSPFSKQTNGKLGIYLNSGQEALGMNMDIGGDCRPAPARFDSQKTLISFDITDQFQDPEASTMKLAKLTSREKLLLQSQHHGTTVTKLQMQNNSYPSLHHSIQNNTYNNGNISKYSPSNSPKGSTSNYKSVKSHWASAAPYSTSPQEQGRPSSLKKNIPDRAKPQDHQSKQQIYSNLLSVTESGGFSNSTSKKSVPWMSVFKNSDKTSYMGSKSLESPSSSPKSSSRLNSSGINRSNSISRGLPASSVDSTLPITIPVVAHVSDKPSKSKRRVMAPEDFANTSTSSKPLSQIPRAVYKGSLSKPDAINHDSFSQTSSAPQPATPLSGLSSTSKSAFKKEVEKKKTGKPTSIKEKPRYNSSPEIPISEHQQKLPLPAGPPEQIANNPASVNKVDKERNHRHAEVVALLNGRKRLSDQFSKNYILGELLGDGAYGFVMTATRLLTKKEVC